MILGRRDRLILLSPPLVIGVLALAPVPDEGTTLCPFALTTGMACPGCGMTRAVSHLLHGDIGAAMSLHPLVPAVVVMAMVGWGWFLLRKTGRAQPMSNRLLNGILIATAIALVGVWISRALAGSLPPV